MGPALGDGLVNLFDLGIVISVAFLLAAISSLDLTQAITGKAQGKDSQTRAADTVVSARTPGIKQVKVEPDEKVVGCGEAIGTVYELSDGRTVIVCEPGLTAGAAVSRSTSGRLTWSASS